MLHIWLSRRLPVFGCLAVCCLFAWLFGCVLDFWAKRQITFLFGFDVVEIATVIPFAWQIYDDENDDDDANANANVDANADDDDDDVDGIEWNV